MEALQTETGLELTKKSGIGKLVVEIDVLDTMFTQDSSEAAAAEGDTQDCHDTWGGTGWTDESALAEVLIAKFEIKLPGLHIICHDIRIQVLRHQ